MAREGRDMKTMNENTIFGLSFLALGLALTVTQDSWIIGLAFFIIGGQRLFVGLTEKDNPDDEPQSGV